MRYGSPLFETWLGLDSLNVMEVARILMGGGGGIHFLTDEASKIGAEN